MANIRYFTGCKQLTNVWHDGTYVSAKHFSGVNSLGVRVQVERMIERKSDPLQPLECDARCTNARGFKCECSCSGKNHQLVTFPAEAVAAWYTPYFANFASKPLAGHSGASLRCWAWR